MEAAETEDAPAPRQETKENAATERKPSLEPPPEAYAAFCKGLTYKFQGDYESAVQEFLKADKYYPLSPTIHLNLAVCYKRLNRKDEMLANLKALSELRPNDLDLHLMLARSLRASGMYREAIEEYEKVWRCDQWKEMPTDRLFDVLASPYLGIAAAYKRDAKFMDAISVYNKLFKHIAGLPGIGVRTMPLRLEIGQLYSKAGRRDKALACYNSLLRDIDELNDPSDSGVPRDVLRLRIARLHDEMGQKEKSIECYIALLGDLEKQKNPTEGGLEPNALRLELGFVYEGSGQTQKAMDCYMGVISANSSGRKSAKVDAREKEIRIAAYLRISYLHANKRRYGDAVKMLRRALDGGLNDSRIYRLLGECLKHSKKYAEALAALKTGISFSPNDRDINFALASLYDDWDMDDKAEEALKKTLEIDPNFPDANNYLGYFYAEKGINLDKAVELVNRALKAMPDNGAYLDSLGWAYYKQALLIDESNRAARQKKMTMALEKLKEAIKRMEDPVIREHLGDVYHTMGQLQKAKVEWEKALSLWAKEENLDLPPGPEGVKKKLEDLRKLEKGKSHPLEQREGPAAAATKH